MKCGNCGRRTSWTRAKCPTCKTKLIQWYIIAVVLFILACYGSLVLLENFMARA